MRQRSAKRAKRVDDADEAVAQQRQPLAHQNQIGIVGDKAAGRAEMHYFAGFGADFAEGMDVGHHVMAKPPLVEIGAGKIHVVEMGRAFPEVGMA